MKIRVIVLKYFYNFRNNLELTQSKEILPVVGIIIEYNNGYGLQIRDIGFLIMVTDCKSAKSGGVSPVMQNIIEAQSEIISQTVSNQLQEKEKK